MGVSYTTRERVKSALDIAETARVNALVDRAIESGSRMAEGLLQRRFYPWTGTRYKDWPDVQSRRSWKLYLDEDELVSVTSLVAGGVTIASGSYFLEPSNAPALGLPYTQIQINLASTAVFDSDDTHQRAIAIGGVFAGCTLDETPGGTLAEALDSSETAVDVSDSASVGIGSLLRVDSERMIVTNKTLLTTGQTLQTPLTAAESDQSVVVTTGSAFAVDEMITLDAERMRIVDIAGNTLVVQRAQDGSTLAAHTGSTIYAPRTLTVQRGVLGTTAAAHSSGADLAVHVVPGPVESLSTAYALNEVLQKASGYARISGAGENAKEFTGRGIKSLEADAVQAYGRRARYRGVR